MAKFTFLATLLAGALLLPIESRAAQSTGAAKAGDEKKESTGKGEPCPCEECAAHARAKVKPTGQVGELLPSVSATVVRGGKASVVDTAKMGNPTVFLLVGVNCPITKSTAERIAALETAYMAKGVDFVHVYADATEEVAVRAAFHERCKFAGAFWNDEKAAFAKAIKASATGEVLLVGKDGKVLYRGAIDDSPGDASKAKERYLGSALDKLLADQALAKRSAPRDV